MTWADEIDLALRRSGGGLTSLDLLRWLRAGQAQLFVCGTMHGSLWYRDGGAELAHVAGSWDDGCARWLLKRATQAALQRGIERIEINGRPGWRRFLMMKGFTDGR